MQCIDNESADSKYIKKVDNEEYAVYLSPRLYWEADAKSCSWELCSCLCRMIYSGAAV